IFEAARAERLANKRSLGVQMADALRPIKLLFTAYPKRLAALAAALLPFTMGVTSSLAFMPKLLQDTHGYSPLQVSLLFLAGGTFAICGNLLAGRIADNIGRKTVLVAAGSIAALGGVYGYLWATGPALVICWMVTLFAFFAASTSVAALTGEIFPTSYRATASAMRGLIGAVGAGIGLMLQSELYEITGNHAEAIVWLLALVPVGMVATLLFLPETAGRNLEDIAPEVA
ncbi:MAG: MFS transporter, partial [Alphaproteobacteria bacterium]